MLRRKTVLPLLAMLRMAIRALDDLSVRLAYGAEMPPSFLSAQNPHPFVVFKLIATWGFFYGLTDRL